MDPWSRLSGTELIVAGKSLVQERLERLGCTVTLPSNPRDGKLQVRTLSGRALEAFIATQRVGGYAFWAKRRLQPSADRVAVLVLLDTGTEPSLYLIPSTEWLRATSPLTDRDYAGKASEPELGIEIGHASLASLRRYAWTGERARNQFG